MVKTIIFPEIPTPFLLIKASKSTNCNIQHFNTAKLQESLKKIPF